MVIKPLFITGFLFELFRPLGLGIGPDGIHVVIDPEGIMVSHFAGVLFENPEIPGQWLGQTNDFYGRATLRNFQFGETELRFKKRYDNRGDDINYYFQRLNAESQQWTGTFQGSAVGKGKANCLITEIPQDMMLPPLT